MSDDKKNEIFWDKEENIDDPGFRVFAFSTSVSSTEPYSSFRVSTWGDIGNLGFSPKLNPEQAHSELERAIADLDIQSIKSKNIDECLNLMRQCYEDNIVNAIEYLERCEQKIYKSIDSDEMIDTYEATPLNVAYFQVIRAQIRAQRQQWEECSHLCERIHKKWMHHAPEYRRPYILGKLYVHALCMAEWDQALRYLKHSWSLIKATDAHRRHAFGLWDEWTCNLLLTWFFIKHVDDFKEKYLKEFHTTIDPFHFQKKSIILNYMEDGIISELIPKFYYDKIRSLYPQFPEIYFKDSIGN